MNGLPASPIAGSSNTSSWSGMIGEMSGGQHRVDEVTRTESRGLDRKNNPRIAAHRPPKETAGLRNAGVCAKGTKKESNTLDVADFVRDVANRGWLLKKPVFLRKVENRVIENVQETEKNRL